VPGPEGVEHFGEGEGLLGPAPPGGQRRLRVLGTAAEAGEHLDQVVPAGAAQVLAADGGGQPVRLRLGDDPFGQPSVSTGTWASRASTRVETATGGFISDRPQPERTGVVVPRHRL
jgi:hypothetical protein